MPVQPVVVVIVVGWAAQRVVECAVTIHTPSILRRRHMEESSEFSCSYIPTHFRCKLLVLKNNNILNGAAILLPSQKKKTKMKRTSGKTFIFTQPVSQSVRELCKFTVTTKEETTTTTEKCDRLVVDGSEREKRFDD